MKESVRRFAPLLVLAVAFAGFVQMCVVLAGRVPAGALTASLTAGALAVALLATPRPLAALGSLARVATLQACLAGLLAMAGAPALVAAMRMSDAPAGSIVVFWVAGGWAAVAACGAAVIALRKRAVLGAGWSVAGALLALAGAAGVVADWERPSSFSPLVRFAPRELAILLGGVLLVAGGLMLLRAARSAHLDGALLWASGSALAVSLVWWGASGFADGWGSLVEQPLVVAVAAVAWGLVCSAWPMALRAWGLAPSAAALSVTPVLLSGLILVEQAVGVAGPQPLIVPGVVAGSLLVLAGVCAFARASVVEARAVIKRPLLIAVAAAVPALCALIGLVLPAILASAEVTVTGGAFAASWPLLGFESVAGWAALALAVLVLVAAYDARPLVPLAVALAAAAAWPWLRDVPTHVWNATLAPEIQVYYGTEYGSIRFAPIANAPMAAAVILAAVASLAIIAVLLLRPRSLASHPDDGGS